jgi:hypothetical protein
VLKLRLVTDFSEEFCSCFPLVPLGVGLHFGPLPTYSKILHTHLPYHLIRLYIIRTVEIVSLKNLKMIAVHDFISTLQIFMS